MFLGTVIIWGLYSKYQDSIEVDSQWKSMKLIKAMKQKNRL